MNETVALSAVALAMLAALPALERRLELSIAKHPSLSGHARIARRVAAHLPGYAYDADRFFNSDGAPAEAVARRRAGLQRLAAGFATRHPRSLALSREAAEGLTDLQFTGAYRVLAVSAGMSGDKGTAEMALAELRRTQPNLSLAWIATQLPWGNDADREHYLEGFRRAGLT